MPFEFLQYLSAALKHNNGLVRQGADQKVRSAQSAYLYLLIDDAPFPFRYTERISDRSVSFYCLFFDNFFLQSFLCFRKRVLGESISPNEASVPLGKWLATCVPRHYGKSAWFTRFVFAEYGGCFRPFYFPFACRFKFMICL